MACMVGADPYGIQTSSLVQRHQGQASATQTIVASGLIEQHFIICLD